MLKKTWIFSLDSLIANPRSRKLLKVLIGCFFLISGFFLSHNWYFKDNSLLGIKYLAETLVSLATFLFGFMLLPRWLLFIKRWIEQLITKTITDIVSAFWTQQSAKITEERRKKANTKLKKEQEEKMKAETQLETQLKNAVLLDTSVLIDGRILYIVKTGFFPQKLAILPAVIRELHAMADSADDVKRQKGRRGLDNINKLKKIATVSLPDIKDIKEQETNVDAALINIAKKYNSEITTLDFNLNKVATTTGIRVLNINELVEALKRVVVPGEIFTVLITAVGKEKNQGVGYLEDGTMVVVTGGNGLVGAQTMVKVTKVIQSQAGKMIFCSVK